MAGLPEIKDLDEILTKEVVLVRNGIVRNFEDIRDALDIDKSLMDEIVQLNILSKDITINILKVKYS